MTRAVMEPCRYYPRHCRAPIISAHSCPNWQKDTRHDAVAVGAAAPGWIPGGGDRHRSHRRRRREVLGFDVGDCKDGAFWTAFVRSLKACGLAGVQLVIPDAHTGLRQAVGQ